MNRKDEQEALFWAGLLHPVIFGEIDEKETNRYLKSLAETETVFPNGKRKRPSLSTLRRKLKDFREGGLETLKRKPRSDRGRPRKKRQELLKRAEELKRQQPKRSDQVLNDFLEAEFGQTVPRSTLYRHLKQAGATKLKLGVTEKKVRCRWTRDYTHALWLGDFEEGPYVLFEDEPVPTHLSAFIDCHSRYVVEARYYYSQRLDILIDSVLRAWASHGRPAELYVDNAKVYHSDALTAACYELSIRPVYRAAGDPPPGGLIERFFGTTQTQFEAEVRAGQILDLGQLNRSFSAWLNVSYHQRIHSETGQAPAERYETGLRFIRHVDIQAILPFFMKREERIVHPDFSDVSLNGSFYKVDPRWRGDKIEIRYDPYSAIETVQLYSNRGEYLGMGERYGREKGAHPPQTPSVSLPAPKDNYLELLIRQHDEQLKAQSQGIDYRKLVSQKAWPFASFAQTLARLMGRKGGLSAFNADELELLKKTYIRIPDLDEPLLTEAFESSSEKALLPVLFHLQRLSKRKET